MFKTSKESYKLVASTEKRLSVRLCEIKIINKKLKKPRLVNKLKSYIQGTRLAMCWCLCTIRGWSW